jgi:pimeloyl-ACP methyl ester carboxylesterase
VVVRCSDRADLPALWFVTGFGESGFSYLPLFATALAESHRLMVPDLPGFGVSPPRPGIDTLAALAGVVVHLVNALTPGGRVGLVGHSLGSAIAVRAAESLRDRLLGLVSIEGNLTAEDAYFSGRAVGFAEAQSFKQDLLAHVWKLGGEGGLAFRRYFASLAMADAESLWQLGLDAARSSAGDALGLAYRSLPARKLYCWSEASTQAVTAQYLRAHRLEHHRYPGGHWPMVDAPDDFAEVIGSFFRGAEEP